MPRKRFIITKRKPNILAKLVTDGWGLLLSFLTLKDRASVIKTSKLMQGIVNRHPLDMYHTSIALTKLNLMLTSHYPVNVVGLNVVVTNLDLLTAHLPRVKKLRLTTKYEITRQYLDITPLCSAQRLHRLDLVADVLDLSPLVHCTNLAHLTLVECAQVSSLAQLNRCNKLETLYLHSCTNITLTELVELPALHTIAVNFCPNVTICPPLEGCPNLTQLEFNDCIALRVIDTPSATAVITTNCPSLISVKGPLVSFISDRNGWFNNLMQLTPNLLKLAIIGSLSTVNLSPLSNCPNLTDLSCNGSKVTHIHTLTYLTNLHHLDLCNSYELATLPLLPQLKTVAYAGSSLTDITACSKCPNLDTVYLEKCTKLTDITPLANCSLLTKLSLLNCRKVTTVDFLTKLTTLSLLDSKVTLLHGHSNLTHLTLSNTTISTFTTFGSFSNLTHLHCTNGNHLLQIDGLEELTQLRQLTLDNCGLINSIAPILRCINLCELSLKRCSLIRSISPVASLPNLQRLYLDRCISLEDIDNLSKCTQLVTLTLSGCNRITSLEPIVGCVRLRNINISDCFTIDSIFPLSKCLTLECITLQGCTGITDIYPLSYCPRLKRLDFFQACRVSDLAYFLRNKPISLKEVRARGGEYTYY